eukprot:2633470-Prorocentrum_lima.AAC.1
MAHTCQIDGSPHEAFEGQDRELSSRQEVDMMKGLINMMKQQLRQIKEPLQSRKDTMVQNDEQDIRKEE